MKQRCTDLGNQWWPCDFWKHLTISTMPASVALNFEGNYSLWGPVVTRHVRTPELRHGTTLESIHSVHSMHSMHSMHRSNSEMLAFWWQIVQSSREYCTISLSFVMEKISMHSDANMGEQLDPGMDIAVAEVQGPQFCAHDSGAILAKNRIFSRTRRASCKSLA